MHSPIFAFKLSIGEMEVTVSDLHLGISGYEKAEKVYVIYNDGWKAFYNEDDSEVLGMLAQKLVEYCEKTFLNVFTNTQGWKHYFLLEGTDDE